MNRTGVFCKLVLNILVISIVPYFKTIVLRLKIDFGIKSMAINRMNYQVLTPQFLRLDV